MAMKVVYTVINGEIVSENRNGVKRDYLPDPLGSTVALLDATQTKTDTWTYWPYGEVKARTGTNVTPFQFVGTLGYYTDSSSKVYVRARVGDLAKGRWLTEDPIGFSAGDWNLYRYSSSSPVTLMDRSGTTVYDCWAWGRSIGHSFISTDKCGAWGFRKKGLGCIGAGIVEPDDNYLNDGEPGRGKWGVSCDVVFVDNPPFEKALCKCIDKSKKDPPGYCIGFNQCDDWMNDMYQCGCIGSGQGKFWDKHQRKCRKALW